MWEKNKNKSRRRNRGRSRSSKCRKCRGRQNYDSDNLFWQYLCQSFSRKDVAPWGTPLTCFEVPKAIREPYRSLKSLIRHLKAQEGTS